MDIREPLFQSPDLAPAPVGENAVLLALRDAVQVALRLCMADEIDARHSLSLIFDFENSIAHSGLFGKSSAGFFVVFRSY